MSSRHWIMGAGGGTVLAAVMQVAAAAERVLVIDQEGQTRPAFVQFMDDFRSALSEGQERYDVFIENLDLTRLDRAPDDPERAAGWLIDKYSDRSFDVLVPKVRISLPKQAHDLLCTASLLHQRTLSSPSRGTRILSQDLAQDLGRGSPYLRGDARTSYRESLLWVSHPHGRIP